MSEFRDVNTFFENEEKSNKYLQLLEEAGKRARKTTGDLIEGLKKTNDAILEKLEKNVRLSNNDKKELLSHNQVILRKKLMSEILQTKAKMILIENKITELSEKNENLVPTIAITQGVQQVFLKGRIKSNEALIRKLQLQYQYLESVFGELSEALSQVKEMILINRVSPIIPNIEDLLEQVDELQASSDILAGLAEEAESESETLKEMEEN
jgi:hypothetical protein